MATKIVLETPGSFLLTRISSKNPIQDMDINGVLSILHHLFISEKERLLNDRDLNDKGKKLTWLTSQEIFEIKNEIKEANCKMLNKLLDENEFLAVYFYEEDSEECVKELEELKKIDNLKICQSCQNSCPMICRKMGSYQAPCK